MHKTFTGSSRRQRQVNLSGRSPNANPFGSRVGPQATAAKLQEERAERQYQQALESGTRRAQRIWRGHMSRSEAAQQMRQEFMDQELGTQKKITKTVLAYESQDEALLQLRRLLFFFEPSSHADQALIISFCHRFDVTVRYHMLDTPTRYTHALLRLQNKILAAINHRCTQTQSVQPEAIPQDSHTVAELLGALSEVSNQIPGASANNGASYFESISLVIDHLKASVCLPTSGNSRQEELANKILDAVKLPLRLNSGAKLSEAYKWLSNRLFIHRGLTDSLDASKIRVISDSKTTSTFSGWFSTFEDFVARLADSLDYGQLVVAIRSGQRADATSASTVGPSEIDSIKDANYRLLGMFIYVKSRSRRASEGTGNDDLGDYSTDSNFIDVVTRLLPSIPDLSLMVDPRSSKYAQNTQFLFDQVHKLVDETSLRNLTSNAQETVKFQRPSVARATLYANFALTLVRNFPSEADQMRMWLFLGPSQTSHGSSAGQSAIQFFWNAAKHTETFAQVRNDRQSIKYIVLDAKFFGEFHQIPPTAESDWRVILMFLELYTFVLKVMNDDEFFSTADSNTGEDVLGLSHTRASALPLVDVQDLVTFLKNLGLSLYLDATRLDSNSGRPSGPRSIADLFKMPQDISAADESSLIGPSGPTGASLTYMTTLVTGLLRMIYERDSRRAFLPKDHWLMNDRFNGIFTTDELFKSLIQMEVENATKDEANGGDTEMEDRPASPSQESGSPNRIIGTGRAQRLAQQDSLRRQQNRAFSERQRLFLRPRFDVMENMPYTIPFMKRVHLFREFVKTDKVLRRFGHEEAEYWRHAVHSHANGASLLERQRASIRRGHEMKDAFEQFYQIGDSLKEPIQIVFLDSFGTVEAGIDGGGVTKEFLTSLATQIEKYESLDMFVENEQNLIYPNPSAIDDIKETYPYEPRQVDETLKKFEFVGRVIGKCLYEEILVDLNFAPFFLQKWSLCDETGAPLKESGFRATLDDLRYYDEDLYRGLLSLKNYGGDVESDYNIDFTTIDTAKNLDTGEVRNISRPLRPDGANVKVTSENRLFYVFATARHRLVLQPSRQTNAFLRGLSSMIKPQWLRMFNQNEVQTLLSGTTAPLDLNDLRRNISYSGVYQIGTDGLEHPTIQHFWRVMESLDEQDKRAVIKFVTSTPRAPLLGFGQLNPPFTIRDSGRDEVRLPTSSTCVNLLKLPMYSSFEVLREKLLYAVSAGAGFDLS
ncbi:hypothetical protein EJ05DRAFT_480019 [Pseudovirgaria hyperparasitica]|uniref:HECT-type E3 ubiquitin transferase n=1 Tax=Pseudovirgaria hyperparasitica TaxID=470096 RepID=A0A6A6VVW9_9PEZI|nr:uncharacterized protein EJ05DRAFT_480019 [Pseudovirgaria hyperparasitica]KAF2754009.1 hypothetical protein EJ05DRAFT_480019 [Pseudovirgaria hyperparasitica]